MFKGIFGLCLTDTFMPGEWVFQTRIPELRLLTTTGRCINRGGVSCKVTLLLPYVAVEQGKVAIKLP